MSSNNESQLLAMRSIESYSKSLNTISWVWGGLTIDIYEDRILREHDDIDYLTLNLHSLMPKFRKLAEADGWQTKLLANGDLSLKRVGVKVHLGHVEFSQKARWTHNGDQGSIWFPQEWLPCSPINFCGVDVHVVAPEFQHVMLEHPEMLNPDWKCREKDIFARNYLRCIIKHKGICPQSLFELVSEEKNESFI